MKTPIVLCIHAEKDSIAEDFINKYIFRFAPVKVREPLEIYVNVDGVKHLVRVEKGKWTSYCHGEEMAYDLSSGVLIFLVIEVLPGVDVVVLAGIGEDGGEAVGETPGPDFTRAHEGGFSTIDDAVVLAGVGFVTAGGDGDGWHSERSERSGL